MSYVQINSIHSDSTDWQNGELLDKASTYTVHIGGLTTNTIYVDVRFLTGTGIWDYDSSYNNVSITTSTCWSKDGWDGVATYNKVEYGSASLSNMGPDTYGYITDYKAVFTNVPETTVTIGVSYYDGTEWTSVYYWKLYTPITMSWENKTLSISQTNNQVNVSWNPAKVSNGSTNIIYYLYGGSDSDGSIWYGSSTSATITPTKYDTSIQYYVKATHPDAVNVGWSSTKAFTASSSRITTVPVISSLSYANGKFTVSWNAAVGEYGPSGSAITYTVTYWDSVNNTDKATSSTTALSKSINRWINPTKTTGDITYSFKVTATYDSKTGASNASTKKLSAPTISWPNPTTTVSQVHDQVQVSWNAATVSDSYTGDAVKYKVYCNGVERYNDTGLTTTFTLKSSEYDKALSYYVYAYNDETNGSNTATSATIHSIRITTAPQITKISYSSNSFTITWSSAVGNYGPDGSAITYKVFYKDDQKQKSESSTEATSGKSETINRWSNPRYDDMICTFYVQATYGTTSKNVQSNSTSSTYTLPAPSIVWPNTTLTVTPIGNQVQVSWNPASVNNNYESEPVWYSVTCSIKGIGMADGQYYANDTKSTSITFEPPAYDRELFVEVNAWANYAGGTKWSEGVYFTVSSAPSHYTIKCYINDSWQVCIVKYYDGTQWIECVPKYYDGTQWVECSF